MYDKICKYRKYQKNFWINNKKSNLYYNHDYNID